jgi:hypothetical protein
VCRILLVNLRETLVEFGIAFSSFLLLRFHSLYVCLDLCS